MQINRKDLVWNYVATFMRVASGLIVLPLVLRILPSEKVGLWNIFLSIGTMTALLDFGFSSTFSRNITYIFSGVKELKTTGYVVVGDDKSIDYSLLKSVIVAMKRYYGILTLIFLFIFISFSPFYLSKVLTSYTGNLEEVWVSWYIYGALIAYQLYTFYYASLLTGRGYVKRYQQIVIIGQLFRIGSIVILLLLDVGLISLVVGQLINDVVNRFLCYYTFYDKALELQLKNSISLKTNVIMKLMAPNAIKIGITSVGSFLVNNSIILIASLYLSLTQIASYGVTKQMLDLIGALGTLWFMTFYPKITYHRVNNEMLHVKRMFIKGELALISTFVICGAGLIVVGPYLFDFIGAKTELFPSVLIFVFLIVGFLERNHSLSAQLLLTKNEVPFANAAIISGVFTVLLLLSGLTFLHIGIWALVLAPGIAQVVYQNWKWPLEVNKELKITPSDFKSTLMGVLNFK